MKKEIEQLDTSTAEHIYKWLFPEKEKIFCPTDSTLKAQVREYLKENKLSPFDALEKIRKQNSSMPVMSF